MKKNNVFWVMALCITSLSLPNMGCPTCVGRVAKDSKPFFYDEPEYTHKSSQGTNAEQTAQEESDESKCCEEEL